MAFATSFYIQNFGCRATQADGAAIEASLLAQGLTWAETGSGADLVVLNTCTVTAAADEDARQAIRRVRRENPNAQILVTGCYAQRAPQELATIHGVTWVVGNSHKHQISELIHIGSPGPVCGLEGGLPPRGGHEGDGPVEFHGQIFVSDITAQRSFSSSLLADAIHDRTRPNLKIQDGCNNRCSFCIIPSVRGPSRSATPEQVLAQVESLAGRYREIVLSGINLGRWGRDLPGRPRLAVMVRRLLEETSIARLRLSSIEPMDWTTELLELMAEHQSGASRIARHIHAPLQSGSDRILRLMRRRYRARHYAARIREAERLIPGAAFGADVMVGFPGETDADFEQTRRLIADLPFTYLHVFTYSARPSTPAADLPDQVAAPAKKERNRILRELAAQKGEAFRRSWVGRRLSVVTLDDQNPAGTVALSDNYIKVLIEGARLPAGQIVEVEGSRAEGEFLVSRLLTASVP